MVLPKPPAPSVRGFSVRDLLLDPEPSLRLMRQVESEVPQHPVTDIRELRGHTEMTADGNCIVDSLPGVSNFWVVAGCNVAGLTTSPAIGKVIARVLLGENPGLKIDAVRPTWLRQPFEALSEKALWRYTTRSGIELRMSRRARGQLAGQLMEHITHREE